MQRAADTGTGPVPVIPANLKTPDGKLAADPEGLVPRTVRALKARFPELGVMTTWRWTPTPATDRTA